MNDRIPTKTLGRTGLKVTLVGLGTAFLGSTREDGISGALDEELGFETACTALNAGVNLIDTAPLYGDRASERIIGRIVRERPELMGGVFVSTKAGRFEGGRDYSYDGILRSVDASQERLGRDPLDIVSIHDAMDVPMEQVLGKTGALFALRRLQEEGRIRFLGTAANCPRTNLRYVATGEFDVAILADSWSLVNQFASESIFPIAERYDVGLLGATPLERGLLATGPIAGREYLGRRFGVDCLDQVGKIQQICSSYKIPIAAAALQWCTRENPVAATIPGARNPAEAGENSVAGKVEIPSAFWRDLAPLVKPWNFLEGDLPALPEASPILEPKRSGAR